jgi:hypothetical protein
LTGSRTPGRRKWCRNYGNDTGILCPGRMRMMGLRRMLARRRLRREKRRMLEQMLRVRLEELLTRERGAGNDT